MQLEPIIVSATLNYAGRAEPGFAGVKKNSKKLFDFVTDLSAYDATLTKNSIK